MISAGNYECLKFGHTEVNHMSENKLRLVWRSSFIHFPKLDSLKKCYFSNELLNASTYILNV